jgi:peptidoglycan/xylan/chitin deacetylase (PgdA/CDA1 family)
LRRRVLLACALVGIAAVGVSLHPEMIRSLARAPIALASASPSKPANPSVLSPTAVCPTDPLAPAVTPRVAFDNRPDAAGLAARYGALQYPRGPIAPMQIALTIDDGPDSVLHEQVLDILDKHCLKAAFFFVGALASARPDLVRETAARGHTIGAHSLTHPNNMRRLPASTQDLQIDAGFQAVEKALEASPPDQRARLAPFFRFPGLNDSPAMLSYLGQRYIAVFSADFGADDWKGISAAEIERRGLRDAAESGGGVLIVHESRVHLVETLDDLITQLERRGYRFIQLTPTPGGSALAASASGPLLSPTPPPASARPG